MVLLAMLGDRARARRAPARGRRRRSSAGGRGQGRRGPLRCRSRSLGTAPRRGRLLAAIAAAVAASSRGRARRSSGPGALEALGVAGNNQSTVSRWSVPATLSAVTGIDVDLLRAAARRRLRDRVLGLLAWVARGGDWVRAAGWAAFGLLVASAYMVPWYLIWLLPLAAISRDRALIGGSVVLTALPGGQRGARMSAGRDRGSRGCAPRPSST